MPSYNYQEIAELTGKSREQVRKLAHRLDLKRFVKLGLTYLPQESFDTLEQHFKPKYKREENGRKKISVIEAYLNKPNYRYISQICSISRVTVRKICEDFERDGFIVVDSAMNFAEKIQNKGIFKKGKVWGYQFMVKGIKYYKSGFENEFTASEEMLKLKEKLKK